MVTVKKILVPVDFSEFSINALRYAVGFAGHFSAKIFLLYVMEPASYYQDPAGVFMARFEEVEREIEEEAKNQLNRTAGEEIGDAVNHEILIRRGRPFSEINSAASKYDIDLIIIATHGHTGVEHLLFGSTAEKVVRKAPCPVLTLRKPAKGYKFKC